MLGSMRFLIDFVSCCGIADCETSSAREVPGSSAAGRRRRNDQSEETRALVTGSTAAAAASSSNSPRGAQNRTRKRSRTGPEGEWKPKLAAIAEDKVAAVEEKARREKERAAKRKGSSGGGRGSRDSSSLYGEDYRRSSNQFAGAFPGFPAAPFMM